MTSNISWIHGLDLWLKCRSLSRPMFSMWSIKARNFSVFISCFAKNKESGNTSGMINRWIPIYHVSVYEAMKISTAFRCLHCSCDVQSLRDLSLHPVLSFYMDFQSILTFFWCRLLSTGESLQSLCLWFDDGFIGVLIISSRLTDSRQHRVCSSATLFDVIGIHFEDLHFLSK